MSYISERFKQTPYFMILYGFIGNGSCFNWHSRTASHMSSGWKLGTLLKFSSLIPAVRLALGTSAGTVDPRSLDRFQMSKMRRGDFWNWGLSHLC